MDNICVEQEQEQLSPPKCRSRRNSLQPIDRHINEIYFDHGIDVNAGIDSTCGRKRNSKGELFTNTNVTA